MKERGGEGCVGSVSREKEKRVSSFYFVQTKTKRNPY